MENVINLFSRKRPGATASNVTESAKKESAESTLESESNASGFDSIAKRNAELQEKLRIERAKANTSVLKSYRIK